MTVIVLEGSGNEIIVIAKGTQIIDLQESSGIFEANAPLEANERSGTVF
jgi:hypothetical protein